MICLTGDVHHSGLNSDDRQFCKGSEIDAAYRMAEIAADSGIPLTLFFTGKCAIESPEKMNTLGRLPHIEIGGHNYFAFKPRKLFDFNYKMTGLKNGPYLFQWWEVGHTKRVLEKTCDVEVVSWRDHAYRHDRNTRKILRRHNIMYFSDKLSKDGGQPEWNDGVIDVPINTLPDHDYVFHGSRQPDTIDPAVLLRTHFATLPMTKEDWLNRIIRETREIAKTKGLATILTHPACMEVFDDFKTFKKLCTHLQSFECIKMSEIKQKCHV